MSYKVHLSPDGIWRQCKAKPGNCKLGGEDGHKSFTNEQEFDDWKADSYRNQYGVSANIKSVPKWIKDFSEYAVLSDEKLEYFKSLSPVGKYLFYTKTKEGILLKTDSYGKAIYSALDNERIPPAIRSYVSGYPIHIEADKDETSIEFELPSKDKYTMTADVMTSAGQILSGYTGKPKNLITESDLDGSIIKNLNAYMEVLYTSGNFMPCHKNRGNGATNDQMDYHLNQMLNKTQSQCNVGEVKSGGIDGRQNNCDKIMYEHQNPNGNYVDDMYLNDFINKDGTARVTWDPDGKYAKFRNKKLRVGKFGLSNNVMKGNIDSIIAYNKDKGIDVSKREAKDIFYNELLKNNAKLIVQRNFMIENKYVRGEDGKVKLDNNDRPTLNDKYFNSDGSYNTLAKENIIKGFKSIGLEDDNLIT